MQEVFLGSFSVSADTDLITSINGVTLTPISVADYCALSGNPYAVEVVTTTRGEDLFMSGWNTLDLIGIEAEFTDQNGDNPYSATLTPHLYTSSDKFVGGRPRPKPHKPA